MPAWSYHNQEYTISPNNMDKNYMNNTEQNINLMKKFEIMINTADEKLAKQLISDNASFFTPASDTPLYGWDGYLSVVQWMRKGFSNVHWKLEEMISGENKIAVRWTCTGTHDGEFLNLQPTGKSFSACVMNFYYFDENGKIINDIAAEGMIAILRQIGLCNY